MPPNKMRKYTDLVVGNKFPHILYRTDPPEEYVSPRITIKGGVPHVYANKKHMPLELFLQRLASDETNFRVSAYRSSGATTTVSFQDADRLSYSAELRSVLRTLHTKKGRGATSTPGAPGDVSAPAATSRATKLTLDELERRLERQRRTGEAGEKVAYRYECDRLRALGCAAPEAAVTSLTSSDVSAGYDLLSKFGGETRCIEVKSSTWREDSFFISESERSTLERLGGCGHLYLVLVNEEDPGKSKVIMEIREPFGVDGLVELSPVAYSAKLCVPDKTA
ncbi:MAG: DUF3883 domain-containing protein [Bacteroides sp.]